MKCVCWVREGDNCGTGLIPRLWKAAAVLHQGSKAGLLLQWWAGLLSSNAYYPLLLFSTQAQLYINHWEKNHCLLNEKQLEGEKEELKWERLDLAEMFVFFKWFVFKKSHSHWVGWAGFGFEKVENKVRRRAITTAKSSRRPTLKSF